MRDFFFSCTYHVIVIYCDLIKPSLIRDKWRSKLKNIPERILFQFFSILQYYKRERFSFQFFFSFYSQVLLKLCRSNVQLLLKVFQNAPQILLKLYWSTVRMLPENLSLSLVTLPLYLLSLSIFFNKIFVPLRLFSSQTPALTGTARI